MSFDPQALIRVSHLGDWTVVSIRGGYDHDELVARVAPELQSGAALALDFHGSPSDPDSRGALLAELSRAATEGGARLAVVERSAEMRQAWLDLGVAEVHESLDSAVGDVAPAVVDRPPHERMLPAQGDATLVATDDISGNPTSL